MNIVSEIPLAGQAQSLHDAFFDPRTKDIGYSDLHRHVLSLHERGKLLIVDRPINKDTEMHPLVRLQFRGGLPEPDRKAFLFRQPTDGRNRTFFGATMIGGLAGNREIYSIGMGVPVEKIGESWIRAMANPLPPMVVDDAACHDVVLTGDALRAPGKGLDSVPMPISTPGWDNAPYFNAGGFITKDPDTGVQNFGNYRGQIKDVLRVGMNPSIEQRAGIYQHWLKYKARGEKMPAAIIAGGPPVICYAAIQKVPEDVDELSVAGAVVGTPIRVARAKTVDLLVPAEAEWVIEGLIDTEFLEPEAPFGENHGHVNLSEYNAFMDVTAITRRRNPILPSLMSQMTPSEPSTMRRVTYEPMVHQHLQRTLGIRGIKRVSMHEPLTAGALMVLVVERSMASTEIWRALYAAAQLSRITGIWVVAVTDDIDPENSDAIWWAVCYRAQAQHDLRVLDHRDPGHGPRGTRDNGEMASVLIDATLKGARCPPIALPKREFMERARVLWQELGLPDFTPQTPWYGYSLGFWPEYLEEHARMATSSDYFALGEILRQRRRSDVGMNDPIDEQD